MGNLPHGRAGLYGYGSGTHRAKGLTVVFSQTLGQGAELAMLETWHADEFLAAVERNREYFAPEIPVAHFVFTVDDARTYLQRWADARATDNRYLMGIWLDGTLVGCVQLFDLNAAMGTVEMGVWLDREAQGRGLVTRSCRYVLDWAFKVRGLSRVQWGTNPTNVASIAVARRLGMTREGVLRSAWQVGGVRRDNEIWSMLREDWLSTSDASDASGA
jgi:ribosomal-protein-serine acetyltransferase